MRNSAALPTLTDIRRQGMTDEQAYGLVLARVDEMRKHPDVQRKFMEKIRAGMSEKECVEWVYEMAFCTLFGPPSKEAKA